MKNINQNTDFGKPQTEKKEFFNKTLLKLPEFAFWQGKPVSYEDEKSGFEWNARDYKPAHNCPWGVPQTAVVDQRPQIGTAGKRIPPISKYPELYDQAALGYVSNRVLIATAQKRHLERPIVQTEIDDGEFCYFLGNQKGCDTYNERMKEKIMQESEQLIANNSQYFFLTVTYAYKMHGINITEAWQIFNHQLRNLFQCLRRTYKIDYVCVLEATAKGYPHAHIILAATQNFPEDFKNLPAGEPIKSGQFFDYLSSIMPSPEFMLQKADSYGLKNYLCKYIGKSTNQAVSGVLPHDKGKKATLRKELLSCLMPVLAGVRQFRFSIRNHYSDSQLSLGLLDETNISDEEELKQQLADFVDAMDIGIISADTASGLVNLCIKLLSNCKGHSYIMLGPAKSNPWRKNLGYFDTPPPEEVNNFRLNARPLGCPGCKIYSTLLRYVRSTSSDFQLLNPNPEIKDSEDVQASHECAAILASSVCDIS
jgi:hypothetical protein